MKLRSENKQSLYLTGLYLALIITWLLTADTVIDSLLSASSPLEGWKPGVKLLVVLLILVPLVRQLLQLHAAAPESEQQIPRHYLDVAAMAPMGIFSADTPGLTTYVNERAGKLLGVPAEDMLGDGWQSRVHQDDLGPLMQTWRNAVEHGGAVASEFRMIRGDGSLIWVSGTASPLFDDDGNISGFLGTLADISERRQAEQARDDFQARLQLAVESARIGLWDWDIDTNQVYYSPEWKHQLGYQENEIDNTFEEWHSRVHPDDLERTNSLLQRFLQNPTSEFQNEYRIRHRNGSYLWVFSRGAPVLDKDGKLVRLLGAHVDITEKKLADRQLSESEARYRELFETNPTPMCLWKPDTMRSLAVNDAMVRHYGYTREEFMSMSLTDIRPSEDIPKLMADIDTMPEGAYAQGFGRHIRKNGDIIEVNVRSHPIGSGDALVIMAQITDITDQRRVEQALTRERETLRETTARLNHILSTSPTFLYSVQIQDGKFLPVWVSENVERIFGYTVEEALDPELWEKHIHPDDLSYWLERRNTFASASSMVDEFRFIKKNGEVMWVRAETRRVGETAANVVELVGSWSDITQEHQTRERLRLDAAAFESTRDGVMIAGSDTRIISVNRALLDVSGYAEDELLGQKTNIFKSGRHDRAFYGSMWQDLSETGCWQGEVWNRNKLGRIYPVWLTINAVRNEQNILTHYVAVYTDISKLKQSEEELHRLAHFDPLTGLPNRLLLQSRLEHAVGHAQRRDGLVAVIFMDMDDFKKVNDSLGHVVGDELLTEMANRLRVRVREEDTLARLGGDEFVVLLESLAEAGDAANVANDLLSSMAQPFRLPSGHELHAHSSIGISIYPNDGETPAELLRAADTAMYRAKDEGGNRLLYFTSEMSQEVLTHLKLENAMRQGMEHNEFYLHYQPKVDMRTGKIRSVEALLRWLMPGNVRVAPDDFIPVAERTGLIVPIGTWVIGAACKQYAAWQEQGLPPLSIAVNVSARQFRSPDLQKIIETALDKHGVPAENLTLELTESMLMQRPAEAARTLVLLKEIGVNLSLDDFGTGFSSLAYLTRFPMDILKIDRSFIEGIETDPSARQIITAIIELADGLGLETVAEGVETLAQEEFLRNLGCSTMQGYLISHPLPPEEFMAFYQAREKNRLGKKLG